MDWLEALILVGTGLVVVGAAVLWRVLHRRRERRDARAIEQARAEQRHIPASLHPIVDSGICIGSLTCIRACPEGDILGVVDGAAVLVQGAQCIGHGRCARECPVDAIRLVFGTSERGVDLPEVDTNFESARPGVFIVGELGGMGLIKNAITQGLEVGAHLGRSLQRGSEREAVDVVIVGAGPAGLAAAVACRRIGLSCRVLEQDTLGGTIAHYPRHKIVMTERVQIPGFGRFGSARMSKEELLDDLQRLVDRFELPIEAQTRITAIKGSQGAFELHTTRGEAPARAVVLAIGRRGSPRPLGVPGDDLPKVTYRLIDPQQYAGARVLIVGGGDSAIEAAAQIADDTDADVTVVHRKPAFGRARAANQARIAQLIADGRVRGLMSAVVTRVDETHVRVRVADSEQDVRNDYVIGCLGGQLPTTFLSDNGVAIRRHHGEEAQPNPADKNRRRPGDGGAKQSAWFGLSLAAVGAMIIVALAAVGGDYYSTPSSQRIDSPLHDYLKPAGAWGHGIGIIATAFMLSNFLYPLRKRWRVLAGALPIRRWLTFHVFVGLMSPAVILFHAAFQSNNGLATATIVSMLLVVGAGLVGRYFYQFLPVSGGALVAEAELQGRLERTRAAAEAHAAEASDPDVVRRALAARLKPAARRGLFALMLIGPFELLRHRLEVGRIRRLLPDADVGQMLGAELNAVWRLQVQTDLYDVLRGFFGWWRIIHVTLALFLVLLIAAHIALSLYLGYHWVL